MITNLTITQLALATASLMFIFAIGIVILDIAEELLDALF